MKEVIFKDLGEIKYADAWEIQKQLFSQLIATKLATRNNSQPSKNIRKAYLLFCEHPPVYTLGKNGKAENLLVAKSDLNADYERIDRGGDITFHGPGQLVGYPILDLECFEKSIANYVESLEEIIIELLSNYGLNGVRFCDSPGVWLNASRPGKARKICAIGIKSSRWVTMHGFALNVNTNLSYFKNIIPCGIEGKPVTSMSKELGKEVDFQGVKDKLKKIFCTSFSAKLIESEP